MRCGIYISIQRSLVDFYACILFLVMVHVYKQLSQIFHVIKLIHSYFSIWKMISWLFSSLWASERERRWSTIKSYCEVLKTFHSCMKYIIFPGYAVLTIKPASNYSLCVVGTQQMFMSQKKDIIKSMSTWDSIQKESSWKVILKPTELYIYHVTFFLNFGIKSKQRQKWDSLLSSVVEVSSVFSRTF